MKSKMVSNMNVLSVVLKYMKQSTMLMVCAINAVLTSKKQKKTK